MDPTIKRITSQEDGSPLPWVNLYDLEYTNKGARRRWRLCSRKSEKELACLNPSNSHPDAVIIVAKVGARLLVTNEFRPVIGAREWGFPAGLVESGEDPIVAAKRELIEETGHKILDILEVSPCIYSSSGLTDESVVVVLCEAEKIGLPKPEEAEDIAFGIYDRKEVRELLKNSENKFAAKAWPYLMMFSRGVL